MNRPGRQVTGPVACDRESRRFAPGQALPRDAGTQSQTLRWAVAMPLTGQLVPFSIEGSLSTGGISSAARLFDK